jgi:DNA-binding CsgD family transcriptional regulator
VAKSRSTRVGRRRTAALVVGLAVAAMALIGSLPADAATPATDRTRSFVMTRGEFRPVAVPGATVTLVHGIDDGGDTTGAYLDVDGTAHGFLKDGRRLITIDVPGAAGTEPFGLNDRLRRGLDLAIRCGAVPVAERARRELIASGARPHRSAITGVAALTATERRTCLLAAQGLTNREIAQALFVTARTVEGHLTHTFQKLDLSSRDDLPLALDARA